MAFTGIQGNEKDKGKVVLTMDDLSNALGEHGVNARKPDYCELASAPVAVRNRGKLIRIDVAREDF